MERAQSSPRRAGTEQSGISSDDDPVAQSAEQLPFKQWVRGSNPRRVTRKTLEPQRLGGFSIAIFTLLRFPYFDVFLGHLRLFCCKSAANFLSPERTAPLSF